ncbi:4'-phosphopantetheinyl transferase [Kitasatospora sp. MBT63]|uniref:4'-phosphopantetheinyl transferase family protein n=1 Tax=Kitasatospora sp. MBT63 TaxID=1444768 RepID=UPI00053A7123|nr:4'-phosphopantetheinyl transferase superfamily protein [Kitasatospora sp. MBT63]
MLDLILPAGAAWAQVLDDRDAPALLPQEAALTRDMAPGRLREFTTVRGCARQALARLGEPPGPILPGPRGEPRWPAGVVGSMTHCAGYRAAAVARRSELPTLGIDAEPHRALDPGVLTAVSLPQERTRLAALRLRSPGIHWDRLLFSVKESVFKAWYPLTSRPLGFEEADVSLFPDGRWHAHLRVLGPAPRGFAGRWLSTGPLLLTATAEPL